MASPIYSKRLPKQAISTKEIRWAAAEEISAEIETAAETVSATETATEIEIETATAAEMAEEALSTETAAETATAMIEKENNCCNLEIKEI